MESTCKYLFPWFMNISDASFGSQSSECCWITSSLTKASSKKYHMETISYNLTGIKKKCLFPPKKYLELNKNYVTGLTDESKHVKC